MYCVCDVSVVCVLRFVCVWRVCGCGACLVCVCVCESFGVCDCVYGVVRCVWVVCVIFVCVVICVCGECV